MQLDTFVNTIGQDPALDFEDTMAVISAHYNYQPAGFRNGDLHNEAGQNEGSCKVFAFAQLNQLTQAQTLACFGRHYQDVLNTPQGTDHGNIRNFMQHGWAGISFDSLPLSIR